MPFYWIKTNWFVKKIFSKYIWDIKNNQKIVYLTFDDGPTPMVTKWALQELKKYNIKATFFCIGNNIEKNRKILKKVINDGHSIGNHTFNHTNGWKVKTQDYIKDVELYQDAFNHFSIHNSKLFRPPYGKIKPAQSKILLKLGYKIIMWDVLSADFDINISPEKCLQNVLQNATSGSIIVFHDSVKAFKNLEYALPKTIKILRDRGFEFGIIG